MCSRARTRSFGRRWTLSVACTPGLPRRAPCGVWMRRACSRTAGVRGGVLRARIRRVGRSSSAPVTFQRADGDLRHRDGRGVRLLQPHSDRVMISSCSWSRWQSDIEVRSSSSGTTSTYTTMDAPSAGPGTTRATIIGSPSRTRPSTPPGSTRLWFSSGESLETAPSAACRLSRSGHWGTSRTGTIMKVTPSTGPSEVQGTSDPDATMDPMPAASIDPRKAESTTERLQQHCGLTHLRARKRGLTLSWYARSDD